MPLISCLASASATFIGKMRRQLAGGFREPLALARKNNCSLQSTFFPLNSIHNNVTFCRETFQKRPQAENSPKYGTGSVDFWHSTKIQTLQSGMDTRFIGLLLLAAPSLQCSMCPFTCPCFYITPDLYFYISPGTYWCRLVRSPAVFSQTRLGTLWRNETALFHHFV